MASQSNGGAPETTILRALTDSVCFLTRMQIHDTMGNESIADCQVTTVGNNWVLTINTDVGGGDPDIICEARCINW